MADLYVSQVTLEVDGKSINDFKSVTPGETEYYKPVNLMTKTGFMKTQERHNVSVEYVVPETGEFDWSSVVNGRLTIQYQNGGKRITYTGVYVLKVGEVKFEVENEATKNIDLGATGKIEE